MNQYSLLVFVHVLGAVALFAAAGIEAVALGRLQRADTSAGVRTWLELLQTSGRLGPTGMLALVATGIWMGVTVWGHQWWMFDAFAATIAMGALGGGVTGRRVRRLARALAVGAGPEQSENVRSLLSARSLVLSFRLRVALGVGIVALMTLKPAPLPSAIILAAAVAAGLAAGLLPGAAAARPPGASARDRGEGPLPVADRSGP